MSIDVAAENTRTEGVTDRDLLMVSGHGDLEVAGFTRSPSYNTGETVEFCCTGGATTIDVYRCGWYGGAGFRLVATVDNTPTTQPEAVEIPGSQGGTTCTAWSVTAVWNVPADACSGVYLALVRSIPPNAPNAFWVTFVIRDDAAAADLIYKTSDSTWGAAYNHYGTPAAVNGKNVYGAGVGVGAVGDRCVAVSYHRPVITRGTVVQTYWQACELPMIRWLERNGYAMKYITCVDLDRGADLGSSVLLCSGHDEYWSQPMRDAARAHRDGGNHLVFATANEVFWRTRHVYVGDECRVWCYKDTMSGPGEHIAGVPLDPVSWTGTWKDTRWAGREPEHTLTGTDFRMNGVIEFDAHIAATDHPAWRNAALPATITGVIGFEADRMLPTRPEPVVLAETAVNIDGRYANDDGQTYDGNGTLDWGIVAQRYDSGAVVVGMGTCQWGWGLDGTHDRGTDATSAAARQFTVNLLTDLGAVPATPAGGVVITAAVPLSAYGPEPGRRWRLRGGAGLSARDAAGRDLTAQIGSRT